MSQPVAEMLCSIRTRMVDRIGDNPYRTWFGGGTDFQFDGECLGVTVPSAFVGQWIHNNYLPHLREVTREVLGHDSKVEIRVVPAATPEPAPALAASPAPAAPALRAVRAGRATTPLLRGTLDTFVVGPSNELAYSVAANLVKSPGKAFKHVVVHGGCGLGKTHLLQGICNGVSRLHPGLTWQYLSGEEFTNEFIYAVTAGRVDQFRARFRHVDLLVIDDIHFVANKKATQEEFLHTFNAIDASGKTVVLSSDRHPRSIGTLSEPLVNRLIAATVVGIDPPDFATRREILRRRSESMLCVLPADVLDFLARFITRNVRELEGALYKLAAYASLTKEPITLSLAQRAVEDYAGRARPPEAADVERVVGQYFNLGRDAIRSEARDRTVALARALTMYLIRRHTRMSFPEIGRLLGNKQHSTVLMAVRRIEQQLSAGGAVTWRTPTGARDAPIRAVLEEIEHRLAVRREPV